MKERPILFSAPMVRAILAGTKTQTRRVVKPWEPRPSAAAKAVPEDVAYLPDFTCYRSMCPYGKPGDRLWVREAHSIGPGPGVHLEPGETAGALRWPHVTYLADGAIERRDMRWKGAFGVGRPSIHMPRWASRITLEVTGVRVERLQDISEADAQAEGVTPYTNHPGRFLSEHKPGLNFPSAVAAYRDLWESINGPGSWDANPWVWVIEFQRLPTNQRESEGGKR